ncbi:methyltransferase [Acinetobacter sp. LoGeW2-3]|uniref:O-methyltransferase n=1 Tax=Acinetobacter sp. LoGeW2-3 TaxID=1808001 RepID=UPI000C059007|nr:O-methyltransferase [Acinetobacter sp. LoGeW2-3]ATO20205.1 methyltransferase [Acinetobacter sp. LoGeW2-3]
MEQLNNFQNYVSELYARFSAHDAGLTDRLQRYRNIEPESAQFLSILIRAQQSKRVLEIGTSTGYSTLWLAEALSDTQGHMVTLEIDAERSKEAEQHAQHLKLDHCIDFQVMDALNYLKSCQKQFDFILLDAERNAYVEYWNYLPQLLQRQGGLLVVDNVLSHTEQVAEFKELVDQDKRFVSSTLNIGAGLLLITFQ